MTDCLTYLSATSTLRQPVFPTLRGNLYDLDKMFSS